MAENGATTRRSLGSETTYLEPTNSAVSRSSSGEAYTILALSTPLSKDIITQESRRRPEETLFAAGSNNILVSPDRGIYFQNKETPLTEKGRIHSTRLETSFTESGSEEVSSDGGASHTILSFKRDSLPVTITRYHISCYDNLGIRHYWVDFSLSLTNAPALSPGVTYNVATLVILGTF